MSLYRKQNPILIEVSIKCLVLASYWESAQFEADVESLALAEFMEGGVKA
jgi:hypothetical protein